MNKAVFLDRDGTINVEKEYLWRIEDFVFIEGAVEALRELKKSGFKLIVLTNQSGVARGYYTEENVKRLHEWMRRELMHYGVDLDGIYYCPHHPEGKIKKYRISCDCRKPEIGMFLQAVKEHEIDLSKSYAVGDKLRDCCICKTTQCKGFLIGENELPDKIEAVKKGMIKRVCWSEDLRACTKIICKG